MRIRIRYEAVFEVPERYRQTMVLPLSMGHRTGKGPTLDDASRMDAFFTLVMRVQEGTPWIDLVDANEEPPLTN